jgi:hypothetical protein
MVVIGIVLRLPELLRLRGHPHLDNLALAPGAVFMPSAVATNLILVDIIFLSFFMSFTSFWRRGR